MAITDWPASAFPDELIAAYPKAKVILHVRPTDKWFASAQSTIFNLNDMSSVPILLRPLAMFTGYMVMTYGPLLGRFSLLLWTLIVFEADDGLACREDEADAIRYTSTRNERQ